ncbi:unnamed protein product [Ectocarpus sp. CCAP 1310/34]|nr:unnamed protein product [Ectocarpus sp. CCAP 1310/34]
MQGKGVASLLLAPFFNFDVFPSDGNGAFIADTQGRIDGKCKQCKDEAKEGVFHLIHSQKCSHTGCNKYPSYGFKADGKKRCCADHVAEGMTNLLKKCEECRKTASYGFPGLARTHCGQHKKNGMAGPSKGTAERPVVPQPRAPATAVDVAAAAFVAAGVTAMESSASPGAGSAAASDVEPATGAEQGISRLSVLVSAAEAASVQGREFSHFSQDAERVAQAEKKRKEESEKLVREREREAADKAKEENDELRRKLATLEAKRREQQAEINAAAQAKADTEKLERRLARVQQDRDKLRDQLKKASPPARDHLRRSTQQQPPVQRPALTVHDVMEKDLFSHDALKEINSLIHCKGLGTKVAFAEGDTLLTVVLPDVDVPAGYEKKGGGYTCMGYIMHADGLGALVIDPSKTMRGTIPACRAFMEISLLRLLNHSFAPNAKLVIHGGGGRMKPWWYERAGGVEYGWWYECSIVACADIEVGAEVTIEYADPPKGAKRPQPPKRASKRSRRR